MIKTADNKRLRGLGWYPFAVLLFVSLCWSWVIMVNVAIITPSTTLGLLTAAIAFFLLVTCSTVIFVMGIGFMKRYQNKFNAWGLCALFVAWAFLEWLVSWVVAMIWYGDGGSVDTVLPFSSFTPFLMYTPLGYLSRLVGFHGLSAVFVVLCAVTVLKGVRHLRLPTYIFVATLTMLAYVGLMGSNNKVTSVTMMSEYLEYPVQVRNPKSDVVLLPEYGLDTITEDTLEQRFPDGMPSAFIGSKQLLVPDGGTRNRLIYGEGDKFVKEVDKSRLIPGGEYLPFAVDRALSLTNNNSTKQSFLYRRKVIKGDSSAQPLVIPNGEKIGALVCSSIIATEDYRSLAKNGATILTNSASLGIFHGSPIFEIQHGGFARFMAVANAKPFVQSSSFGPAFALDHDGRTVARVSPGNVANVLLTPKSDRTMYTLLGEWPVLIGFLLGAVFLVGKAREKFANSHRG